MDKIVCGYRLKKDLKSGLPLHYMSYLVYTNIVLFVNNNTGYKLQQGFMQGSAMELMTRYMDPKICNDMDITTVLQTVKKLKPILGITKSQGSQFNYVFLKKTKRFCRFEVNNSNLSLLYYMGQFMNHPGIELLKALNFSQIIENIFQQIPKEKYIKSEFIHNKFLSIFEPIGSTEHGPAVTVDLTKHGFFQCDFVPYIHFEGWPKSALE
jgi:hypothetical protein